MAIGQWSEQEKDILAYALKYFEIHAAQRMSVFNFFIVLSTIILTGLATCVFGEGMYAPIGIALGLLLTALALTFWKLDQRTSFLVKRAEKTLKLSCSYRCRRRPSSPQASHRSRTCKPEC